MRIPQRDSATSLRFRKLTQTPEAANDGLSESKPNNHIRRFLYGAGDRGFDGPSTKEDEIKQKNRGDSRPIKEKREEIISNNGLEN